MIFLKEGKERERERARSNLFKSDYHAITALNFPNTILIKIRYCSNSKLFFNAS